MSHCVDCGLPVPDGQHTCSMCYGDPYHGRDGYYMEWLERRRMGAEDQPDPDMEDEAIPLGERPSWFFDKSDPF